MTDHSIILRLAACDVLGEIVIFLPVRDFARLKHCCRNVLGSSANHYWKELLSRAKFISPRALGLSLSATSLYSVSLLNSLKKNNISNIIQRLVKVSTFDRPEESGKNVLNKSTCKELFDAHLRPRNLHGIQYQMAAIQIQTLFCRCAGGQPCYWSSSPSSNAAVEEYILFEAVPRVSHVLGLSVTPYQAFFQPDMPVYAPREVRLQLLAPSLSALRTASDLDGWYSFEETDYEVYAESEPLLLANTFTQQYFFFDEPMHARPGTQMRLLVRGMHQRQTLTEQDVGEHFNDYYVCLSHVSIFGVVMPAKFISEVHPDLLQEEIAASSSSKIRNLACSGNSGALWERRSAGKEVEVMDDDILGRDGKASLVEGAKRFAMRFIVRELPSRAEEVDQKSPRVASASSASDSGGQPGASGSSLFSSVLSTISIMTTSRTPSSSSEVMPPARAISRGARAVPAADAQQAGPLDAKDLQAVKEHLHRTYGSWI